MAARQYHHRDPSGGEHQQFDGRQHGLTGGLTSVKQIARVNDDIHFALPRGGERGSKRMLGVSSANVSPRCRILGSEDRPFQAEMGVRHMEQFHGVG